jgi:predicted neuraminidase
VDADFLHSPTGAGPRCHAPTLACTAATDLVAAWYAYPEDECRGGVIVASRLPAGARTWTEAAIVARDNRRSTGNPVLFVDPAGRLHLLYVVLDGPYWNDAQLLGMVSDDGGVTWNGPEPAAVTRGTMIRHPPLARPDGQLLLPVYDERTRRSSLLASRAPWTRWTESVRFEGDDLIQPVVLDGGAGNLTALFRPAAERRRVYRSISRDGGDTWSPPIVTSLPSPPSGIAACAQHGAIIAVYNHTEAHQRTPLSLARSADHGQSWSEPLHLDGAPFEVSYPATIPTADGRIHVVYSFNRRMIRHCAIDVDRLP